MADQLSADELRRLAEAAGRKVNVYRDNDGELWMDYQITSTGQIHVLVRQALERLDKDQRLRLSTIVQETAGKSPWWECEHRILMLPPEVVARIILEVCDE